MKASLTHLVPALVFLLGGCGSTMTTRSELDSSQSNTTKIGPNETVSIILDRHRHCEDDRKQDCWVYSTSESEEQAFESCLSTSLLKQQAKLNIFPAKEFRRVAFPDKEFLASPRNPGAIIVLLGDDEFKRRIATTRVHYLIILDSETSNTGKHWGGDCTGNGCLDFRQTWVRVSNIYATIIDVQHALRFGVAEANATGKAGYVIPILAYIPVPLPIPFFSATESRACTGLGQELGQKFFTTPDAAQVAN